MNATVLKFSFTTTELKEVVKKYFGEKPDDLVMVCYSDVLQKVKLEDLDFWCKKMVPYIPYLNEKVSDGKLDAINFLNWTFLIFYDGWWHSVNAMDRQTYCVIEHIQKELGVPPNKHIWFNDEDWYQECIKEHSAKQAKTEKPFYGYGQSTTFRNSNAFDTPEQYNDFLNDG